MIIDRQRHGAATLTFRTRLINEHDDVWSDLKIWNDVNGNGVTDAGELMHVNYFGIQEFDLNYQENNTESGGNTISGSGFVRRITGVISAVFEAIFNFFSN